MGCHHVQHTARLQLQVAESHAIAPLQDASPPPLKASALMNDETLHCNQPIQAIKNEIKQDQHRTLMASIRLKIHSFHVFDNKKTHVNRLRCWLRFHEPLDELFGKVCSWLLLLNDLNGFLTNLSFPWRNRTLHSKKTHSHNVHNRLLGHSTVL